MHFKTNQINLWSDDDRFHANVNGSYLAECVWFSELFDVSSKEIKYVSAGMPELIANLMKRHADVR